MNDELLRELRTCKSSGILSPELGSLLLRVAEEAIAEKYPGHSETEDMVSEAMTILCRTWSSFSLEKSDDPYRFYWICAYSAGLGYLAREAKQKSIFIR